MSTETRGQEADLSQLLNRALAKDQRFLRLSLVFTVLAVLIGSGWIVYAASKVTKLQKTEADLKLKVSDLEREIEIKQRTLLSTEASLQYANDLVKQGNSSQEQERVLQALSTAQQSVKTAIEAPTPKPDPVETPTATPTPTAAVPNVRGLKREQAVQAMKQAGLDPRVVDQEGRGTPGTVLYQDPLPQRSIPIRSTVNLYVIPAFTDIPNVKGMTLAEAKKTITEAGLTIEVASQVGRGAPGSVLYQDPLPPKKVRVGTRVKLYVAQ